MFRVLLKKLAQVHLWKKGSFGHKFEVLLLWCLPFREFKVPCNQCGTQW